MARPVLRQTTLALLKHSAKSLSITEISQQLTGEVPLRTLRRWLLEWVSDGTVSRTGTGRATRYQYLVQAVAPEVSQPVSFTFLSGLDNDLKSNLLAQIRDLWTHTSTALEGNVLSLGDTHFILYAKIHMGIAHIHPFWDGNGRIARLLANIPLLKAGLPPLVIPQEQRRGYIQTLANYQIRLGQLNKGTGAWPDLSSLEEFNHFCAGCYGCTRELVSSAFEVQKRRI